MNGVAARPNVVRREGEDAERPSNPVIGPFRAEKCAMAAIMLDQKEPEKEKARSKADPKRQPVANRQGPPRSSPEGDKGKARDAQLEKAAWVAGCTVFGEGFEPIFSNEIARFRI